MAIHSKNVKEMYKTVKEGKGFDWVIVVSSDEKYADFWRERLESLKGQIIGKKTKVLSLTEDWPGGAGQLFGTLYAWQKANKIVDLRKELKKGKKIAVYHTAGHGKRMAPLSLCEEGGKSAVRLPRTLKTNRGKDFLAILDAVIFSTQIFAPTRKGRISVFWGDQIIISPRDLAMEKDAAVEIFYVGYNLPKSEKMWVRELQNYGVVIPAKRGILRREKLSWPEFLKLSAQVSGPQIGKSLGFFSLSPRFLEALSKEFKKEVKERSGKMDIDLGLWVPLTCTKQEYKEYRENTSHWKRVQKFKKHFSLATKDLGRESFYWDFGRIESYKQNLLKTVGKDPEGETMREFFGLEKFWTKSSKSPNLKVNNSILVNSNVKGRIKDSIVFGASSDNLNLKNTLVFNVDASKLNGEHAICYNIQEGALPLDLKRQDVLADVFSQVGKLRVKTKSFRDGKNDWDKKMKGNHLSYKRLAELK